jgi:phenylacetate-CoA ligase
MTNSQDITFASAAAIQSMQEEKLRAMLHYLKNHSPFYRRLFSEKKVNPDTVRTLEDLVTLPTTTKSDMQQYNWDFLCVPKKRSWIIQPLPERWEALSPLP